MITFEFGSHTLTFKIFKNEFSLCIYDKTVIIKPFVLNLLTEFTDSNRANELFHLIKLREYHQDDAATIGGLMISNYLKSPLKGFN